MRSFALYYSIWICLAWLGLSQVIAAQPPAKKSVGRIKERSNAASAGPGPPVKRSKSATDPVLVAALGRAGKNREEIAKAWHAAKGFERESLRFLLEHMPERDVKSLSADFLLQNTRLAITAWKHTPWQPRVSKDIFLNNILPYANVNERRDNWRADFHKRFSPLVKDAKTASEAAAMLNIKIFKQLNVKYSTRRKRADQAPYETIESGLASCTGLSVLLIDACRSVGIPARFVGTPLWTNKSGNHSWVEVWDKRWHFTGAAEPTGKLLDRAWFTGRASKAVRDHPLHAIYAVSYKRTPQHFPLVWNRRIKYVFAVNVTDRYTRSPREPKPGYVEAMFRVLDRRGGQRVAANLRVVDDQGREVYKGRSKDERFDANDHVVLELKQGKIHVVEVSAHGRTTKHRLKASAPDQLHSYYLRKSAERPQRDQSSNVIPLLRKYLTRIGTQAADFRQQPFSRVALTRKEAEQAKRLLWEHHLRRIRQTRAKEMKEQRITDGRFVMPFRFRVFGKKPQGGRSLYISMHGGGQTSKRVNDRQWSNQQGLYKPAEGIYLAPRAPTDTWNMWHRAHIDRMFDRLIQNLVVFEDVNPNRVYLMGYSAGGDGVYQVAPRFADRLAAAAMMAGHPNEASPLGLRNIGFCIHMGGRDKAYNRNRVAGEWKKRLEKLRADDPQGYRHQVKIYPDKGHWMNREDRVAVPWMAKFVRNPLPDHIVWCQDDVRHRRFYWLFTKETLPVRCRVDAKRKDQRIEVSASHPLRLQIRLNDQMIDLDRAVTVVSGTSTLFQGRVQRTIGMLAQTLYERGDPHGCFSAQVVVKVSKSQP